MSEPPAKKKKKSKSTDKRERLGWLEDKTLLYFRRASDQLREGFEDDEDKSAFLDNVFKETAKEEIKLARNQTVSRILEEMIDVAGNPNVESFLAGFTENYHLICTDRFASHVTQALVHKCAEILGDTDATETKLEMDSDSPSKSASSFVTELFNVTYGNMREFVFDTYASHVVRSLLLLMGGCDVRDASLRSGLSQRDHNKRHPSRAPNSPNTLSLSDGLKTKYLPLLEKFCDQCISLGVSDMAQSDVASPVLQAVLKALKTQKSSMADQACEKLVVECRPFDAAEIDPAAIPPALMESAGYCRLVEELLAASSKTRLKSIYKHHLRGRLAALATSPSAPNFVLQRFFRSIRTPTLFALVAEEVLLDLNAFAVKAVQRAALIVFAEKCVEFQSHQNEFVEALMSVLDCLSPPDRQRKLALLVADFKTHDELFGNDAESNNTNNNNALVQVRVSLQGSLLLQRMFSFSCPDAVFNSFMALPPAQLAAFACDPAGCHVFDAIFSSSFLDGVRMNKFVARTKSSLVTMATDKCGSRVVDALWKRASVKNKVDVAEALTKQYGRVAGDRYGKFIARNMRLDDFTLKKDMWMKNLENDAGNRTANGRS